MIRLIKKLRYITLVLILILVVALGLFEYNLNPKAKDNSAATQTLLNFYTAFIDENYSSVAQLLVSHNPQQVINVRHWYGQVKKYQVKEIRNLKNHQKEAKIIITSYIIVRLQRVV